ncbi:TPA: hypothetical protein JBE16_16190 [Legionella pneumophila subsp. pneumophila]|nr:hypothetical protein [Legionella pneumophila subsp. pneumophila]
MKFIKKQIKNFLYYWVSNSQDEDVLSDVEDWESLNERVTKDFNFVKKYLPIAMTWYRKNTEIESFVDEEDYDFLSDTSSRMFDLICKMTTEQYIHLVDNAVVEDFAVDDINKIIDLVKLRIEKQMTSRIREAEIWNQGINKTSQSESLKPIKLSENEVGVFGSELLGYKELQKYFETKAGGNKITYHFAQTEGILLSKDKDTRVWNCDFNSPSEINSNQNKKPSKGSIVDILQENIRRYYNNELLIPIYFIMERKTCNQEVFKQLDGELGDNLQNSGSRTSNSGQKNSITGAEMRTVWRLQNELNDSVIAHILSKTTRGMLVNSTAGKDNFIITSIEEQGSHLLPWEINKNQWLNRKRKYLLTQSKLTHAQHNDWIWRLIWFKNEMLKKPCSRGSLPQIPTLWNRPKVEDLQNNLTDVINRIYREI